MSAAPKLAAEVWLASMRHEADPLADDTVAAILRPWPDGVADNLEPLAAANRAIASWHRNADLRDWQAPAGTPAAVAGSLLRYLQAARALPDWADGAQIAAAERIFMEQGVLSCTLLFCASLPECYVLPDLADVLHTTGQLEQRTDHRIRATAAMIFPVMLNGGLTSDDGAGVAQVLKVRLIHAMVRHLILRRSPAAALADGQPMPRRAPASGSPGMHQALLAHGWDIGRQGLPCNQQELAYTLLTFGYVYVRGLRRLGVGLSQPDEQAVLHTWNVVGHLVGIRRELMVHSVPDAAALFEQLQALGREAVPQPDPRPALAATLMDTMAAAIPWRLAKPMPVLLTRLLCGPPARRDLALDAHVPWLSRALFAAVLALVRGVDAIGRSIRPGFSIARLVTRVLGYRLLTRMLMDQTRPLTLPGHLLARMHGAIAGWGEDPYAPRWVNALEDRFTGAGRWPAP